MYVTSEVGFSLSLPFFISLIVYPWGSLMPSQDQSSGKGSCEELKLPANSHLELWKPVLPPRQAVSQFSSVTQCVQLFATPWTAACQAILPITNSWSLLKLLSFESVRPFNHLILCRPLLLSPSVFPSIRVFSNKGLFSSSHQVAKVLEFLFQHQSFQ